MLRKNGVVNRKINLIYYNILVISRCITFTAMVTNDIHSNLTSTFANDLQVKLLFNSIFNSLVYLHLWLTIIFQGSNLSVCLSQWEQPSKSTGNLIYSDIYSLFSFMESFLCSTITRGNSIPLVFPESILLKFKFTEDFFYPY